MNIGSGSQNSARPRLRLRVSPAAETSLRSGHPWVFADSIRERNRDGDSGELAVIYARKNRFLAIGLYDPESPIGVRVLHTGAPETINDVWWAARLRTALERRRGLFDEETTGFRWINGESDGWPGLVLDRYDSTLVLKIYTRAWLPWLDQVFSLIREQLQPERLVLRLSRNLQNATRYRDGEIIFGTPLTGPVIFRESELCFEADVVRGQKTGFFLDQRENRRHVGALAQGRRVLNAFSFSGGFSLYAARGGAVSVTDLDISAHALASAERNFRLDAGIPEIDACVHKTVQADAFDWLRAQANSRERFELIVLDPPSFARRESERAGALNAYGRLASLASARLTAGGILVACSCSTHVSAEEFFEVIRHSLRSSSRKFEELQTTRHAPDHPATFKEADYLKAIYLKLD